ncbi:GntR family transcriptional regulator [Microbacterium sp. YY-01]|uniref:GntR family transcriptional regulator n=1 Tax=Microbacterium sp. YY-01 TaxID=3421634 RepID=UPI003D183BC1
MKEATSTGADRRSGERTGGLDQFAERHRGGYRSVGDMAYEVLRDAILEGALPPGTKLRQETLAESIGISRLPIRSALIQLESDGLVEFHARRGAVVRALSIDEANEVYLLRILLEREALRLSMQEMTDEKLASLRELARHADATEEGSDFVEARTNFYAALYGASERPVMWEMLEQLRLKLGRYVLGWRMVHSNGHHHTHEQLVDVIAKGDADHAASVLEHHLEHVREGVLDLLRAELDNAS